MPARQFNSDGYRFGFNGQEKDDEVKGSGNSVDFGARIYDSRLGRWWSVDKASTFYAGCSPYEYCGNSTNLFYEIDGNCWGTIIGAVTGGINAAVHGKPVLQGVVNGAIIGLAGDLTFALVVASCGTATPLATAMWAGAFSGIASYGTYCALYHQKMTLQGTVTSTVGGALTAGIFHTVSTGGVKYSTPVKTIPKTSISPQTSHPNSEPPPVVETTGPVETTAPIATTTEANMRAQEVVSTSSQESGSEMPSTNSQKALLYSFEDTHMKEHWESPELNEYKVLKFTENYTQVRNEEFLEEIVRDKMAVDISRPIDKIVEGSVLDWEVGYLKGKGYSQAGPNTLIPPKHN